MCNYTERGRLQLLEHLWRFLAIINSGHMLFVKLQSKSHEYLSLPRFIGILRTGCPTRRVPPATVLSLCQQDTFRGHGLNLPMSPSLTQQCQVRKIVRQQLAVTRDARLEVKFLLGL